MQNAEPLHILYLQLAMKLNHDKFTIAKNGAFFEKKAIFTMDLVDSSLLIGSFSEGQVFIQNILNS